MHRFLALLTILLIPFICEAKNIEVNGTQLYVDTVGRGIPIVVVHGGPGFDQQYLRPYLDELSTQNKVIFYDQRYSGHSFGTPTDQTLTIEQYVDDIEGLRRALNLDRFVILGHSWGGLLAMKYAIKYPSHLDGLILMSSAPASTEEFKEMAISLNKRLSVQQATLNEIKNSKPFKENNPEIMETYFRLVVSAQMHNPLDARKINLSFTPESAKTMGKINETLFGEMAQKPFNLYPALAHLNVPTLVVHGEDDFISTSMAKKIQQCIPKAKYVEIEDAAHYPYAEKKERTLGVIRQFLTELKLVKNSQ